MKTYLRGIVSIACLLFFPSCATAQSPARPENRKPMLTEDGRFWVYQDTMLNSWTPGNWMPAQASEIINTFNLKSEEDPQSGEQCIHFRIDRWQAPYWTGIAFAVPNPKDRDAPYWGETPTRGWDLHGARRIVFWARSPNESRAQFKASIIGDKPYGDSAGRPVATEFLTLTSEWKQYAIDLENKDLNRVVTGFCLVSSRDAQSQPNKPVDIYIDNIYWDFSKSPAKDEPLTKDQTNKRRFWVYRDSNLNEWIPANWMPSQAVKMITAFELDSEDNPYEGENCIRVEIGNWTAPYWCGIAWAVPHPSQPGEAYWGERSAPGWDLTGAKRLVFRARAPEKCAVQFKACILGDKKHGDAARFPAQTRYITLTSEWTKYSIDVSRIDLSRVVSGFCFVLNRNSQPSPNQPVEFYLDDIYWEGVSPDERTVK